MKDTRTRALDFPAVVSLYYPLWIGGAITLFCASQPGTKLPYIGTRTL